MTQSSKLEMWLAVADGQIVAAPGMARARDDPWPLADPEELPAVDFCPLWLNVKIWSWQHARAFSPLWGSCGQGWRVSLPLEGAPGSWERAGPP